MASYDASIRVNTKVDNSDLSKLQKDFDRLEAKLKSLYAKGDKLEALGVDKQGRQWKSLTYDVAQTEIALEDVRERIQEVNVLRTDKVTSGFKAVEKSSRNCFNAIRDGSKKSSGLLSRLGSRLKNILLNFLIFRWIRRGLTAFISYMKEGFQNLAQYSGKFNDAMSAMKSESAQLKNSLAAAFEPIMTSIISYVTQLIHWINQASEAVSKFLAVISGKSAYTRAKKQTVDYAKTLKDASKEAKGALAAFDELNVQQKNDTGTSGNAGGEKTGADAFETVQLTEDDFKIVDTVKEKLKDILDILLLIGFAMAVFGIGGPLGTFVGVLMVVAGLLEFILEYMDAWANGISFDNLEGMLKGLLAVIVGIYILFGPIAMGITLLVGSIALIVLAIKDMTENGVTAQNMIALMIGVVGTLVAIFILFGSTVGIVVAAVVAVIAIFALLIAAAGNGGEAIAALKNMCKNFADFFKKIFAGDVDGAMESLKAAVKDFANVIIIAFESLYNCIIKGLNWVIDKINSLLSFEIPDWVPGVGGKYFSFNLPHINDVTLPRILPALADGAVIPGGRPFAAILGDQPAGQTNIETPLPTMVQAFRQAMSETGGGGNYTFVAQLDGRTIFKETVRQEQLQYKATGIGAFQH